MDLTIFQYEGKGDDKLIDGKYYYKDSDNSLVGPFATIELAAKSCMEQTESGADS